MTSTLDELIAKLSELRNTTPGDAPVYMSTMRGLRVVQQAVGTRVKVTSEIRMVSRGGVQCVVIGRMPT